MDNTSLALLIHELRNQCIYTEVSFRVFNQSIEDKMQAGAFYAAQSTLLTASQIGNTIWPRRSRARKRGEHLRGVLQLDDKHPLNNKKLLSVWDRSDEKFDEWVTSTKGKQIIFDHIGPIPEVDGKQIEEEALFRLYDPSSMVLYFRGVGFQMQSIANAIADIYTRVTAVHKSLLPQQYSAPQEQQPPAETETKPGDQKKTKKKAAPKNKSPAKKTSPKKAKSKKNT